MSNHTNDERCASPKCKRRLTGGVTVIVIKDGRRFCRHHGDRLPSWLRKPVRQAKKPAEPAEPAEPFGAGFDDSLRLPKGF